MVEGLRAGNVKGQIPHASPNAPGGGIRDRGLDRQDRPPAEEDPVEGRPTRHELITQVGPFLRPPQHQNN